MAASITLQLDQTTQEQLISAYQKFAVTPPQHATFAAKLPNVRITVYKSGKILLQGANAETEAAKWETPTTKQKTTTSTTTNKLPNNFANLSVIGSDEVGNGSYFGPLVVCAAFVPHEQIAKLTALGVKDSKMLTDQKMQELTPILKELIAYKVLVVTPEKYNNIQPKYNAVTMKSVLHNRAVALLEQQIAPLKADAILIDQFTSQKHYQQDIQNETPKPTTPVYMETKGEQHHIAVAAASIIARTTFLDWLTEMSTKLQITLPSGAGANVDQIAAQIIQQDGLATLNQLAKLHFANTNKAKQIAKQN